MKEASYSSVDALIRKVLEVGAIFVVEVDPRDASIARGELVAMLALIVLPHPITGQLCADEICWWVEPRCRRGSLGPKLLRHAERWATTQGATMLRMVAPAGTAVGRFYEAVGYSPVETAYQKRL